MNSKLLNIDVDTLTFKDLSSQAQRLIALVATVGIFGMTALAFVVFTNFLERQDIADQVTLAIFVSVLAHYILTGKLAFKTVSDWIARFTPLGVLYRNDMRVINAAKEQLQALSSQVHFSDFECYTRINPYISTQGCLEVSKHQAKGDLQKWLGDVKNLKNMSDLVFQLWIVERSIAAGDYSNP